MRKLLLIFAAVFGGIMFAPIQSQAGVHFGFAVVSPLCYTPPVYIGPTLFFGPGPTGFYSSQTYYSPTGFVAARPYWYNHRFGYFDWWHHWHSA
jgi:hypothetical protein